MKLFYSSAAPREAKSLFVMLWLLVSWAAPATQMKLDSLAACGCTYRNVTVLSYNTTHLCFSHEGGITSLKLKYLDPKLQERFEYDPLLAAEVESQQAADDARYQESMFSKMVEQAQRAALAARRAATTSEDNLADPVSNLSWLGKPVPAIKGEKWLGEKPALEGKVALVAFWAPWSIPCKKYIPELDRLQKKFAGKLAVVGVACETEAEISAMAEPKVEFASVLDPKAELGAAVGVTSIPYVMLVDAKGIVRYQGHPTAITEKQVERLLAKATEVDTPSKSIGLQTAAR
jgi:cytochrome c biogenesis protein CcmG/thiol:disulfide interchange protein DsbE